MLIEMLGVPGAGKSTLTRALLPALRGAGVSVRRAEKLVGLGSASPDAPRYLKRGDDRVALYRNLQFRREFPDLMEHIECKLKLHPTDAFLFAWTTNLFEAAREHGPKNGFTLLDEGFVHRGMSAHLHEEAREFENYLALIPLPGVVLNLCLPPRLAMQRAIARRADKSFSRRKVQAKFGDRLVFRKRHRLIETGIETLQKRGAVILDVDTSQSIETCIADILPKLLRLLASDSAKNTAAE